MTIQELYDIAKAEGKEALDYDFKIYVHEEGRYDIYTQDVDICKEDERIEIFL